MKIAIGISGSSGAVYAKLLLEKLLTYPQIQLAIVFSKNARENLNLEIPDYDLNSLQIPIYSIDDFRAPFASGSAGWDCLIVCPCSAGFLAKVSTGIASDLMSRAAQVMLKERKKLILVFREMPFSLIHIENMRTVTLAGGIICLAIPAFYTDAKSTEEILMTVINRVVDLIGLNSNSFQWGEK